MGTLGIVRLGGREERREELEGVFKFMYEIFSKLNKNNLQDKTNKYTKYDN